MGRKWRWFGLGLVIVAALAIGPWIGNRLRPLPTETAPEPLPPIAASPYRNTAFPTKYIGSQACRDCHAEQYDSYLQTMHSRSLNDIDLATEPLGGK